MKKLVLMKLVTDRKELRKYEFSSVAELPRFYCTSLARLCRRAIHDMKCKLSLSYRSIPFWLHNCLEAVWPSG